MKTQEIIMIAAIQNDHGIGYKNGLLHSIKNDMKHFVDTTVGNTVIMGRKNWESIPEKFRPFKNRENIIITRDKNYTAKGAIVVHSLEEAIERSTRNKIYIIGGAQIYNLGMKYANTLDITHIFGHKIADTFFPEIPSDFVLESKSSMLYDETSNTDYQFQTWKRRKAA